ncbi:hypothetical protein GCM10009416_25040 [Craurococcus roseus]|uniref:Uncharacterized protein n=1 Tax=Craurococcus roseus TaxID=77585 RepID=A0ABN1F9B3_9PROT
MAGFASAASLPARGRRRKWAGGSGRLPRRPACGPRRRDTPGGQPTRLSHLPRCAHPHGGAWARFARGILRPGPRGVPGGLRDEDNGIGDRGSDKENEGVRAARHIIPLRSAHFSAAYIIRTTRPHRLQG